MIPLRDDNPTATHPVFTVAIIIACVAVFLWQFSLGERMAQVIIQLGATPALLFGHRTLATQDSLIPIWLTSISSMFLHGGWLHLIGNMLYLWIFGNNIEDALGHFRFIVFYVSCGIVALFANALPDTHSIIPMIGASGAISGILGAYLLLYPHARILIFVPFGFLSRTIWLPAYYVLLLWFVLQVILGLLTAGQQGGVAWGAHIGGFVAGAILVPFFKKRSVRLFSRHGQH